MSFSCALVGLPNVGKSTIFNIILKKAVALAENFPFCTIEPNKGSVAIQDPRLNILAKLSNSEKIINAIIDCVDVAGLIKGASKGEGLGNEFLGHIRTCDLIVHVVRCFGSSEVIHVENSVNPLRDYETIVSELIIADIIKFEKLVDASDKKSKNRTAAQKELIAKALAILMKNEMLNLHNFSKDEIMFFNQEGILTHKPMIVVANMETKEDEIYFEKIAHLNPIKIFAQDELILQNTQEDELDQIKSLLQIEETGINYLIKKCYEKLNLLTFFTTGKMETRAWRIENGYTMQDCAGCIHSDFYKSFISAQVINFEDFVEYKTFDALQKAGKIQLCSKDYIAKDGQICIFKTFK